MSIRVLILAGALGAFGALALPASAQIPAEVRDTAEAVRRLQEELQSGRLTPERLRARIEAAGLTMNDVRDRLRAAGYPEGLLDRYLGVGRGPEGVSLSESQVESVLRRLSIPPLDRLPAADSLGRLAPDTLALDSLLMDTLTVAREEELEVFGRSLFERATTQFQPVTMGPVPSNYQLGPGDELVLILTGDVQEVYTLPVTREGFVVIPDVGQVPVNGMTLSELKNALYTYLGRVYSGVMRGPEATTHFEVSISRLRQNQVFVIGEVERPAQYEVASVATALDALYQAGGPTENGSFRNIQIRRGERLVGTLDVYEYLTEGAATGDIPLDQGDVVFVPVRSRRVQIDGNVVRPGIYELKGQEGLRALLELAGGIEPEADLRRVQIDRVLPPEEREQGVERTLFDVNVAELLDEEGQLVALRPGDRVYVFAIAEERRNTVTIRGNVWSPGVYAYRPDLTVRQLIDRAGGLRDDTYMGRAQIVRLDPRDRSRRVIPVSLAAGADPELREYDEVVVYSASELRDERFVTIHGPVKNPGSYEFSEDMTVNDLILMAGGLLDQADTARAEVARLVDRPDRTGDLTEIITVQLDTLAGGGTDGASNGRTLAGPDFTLARYDAVYVHRRAGWEPTRTVHLTGEVQQPGAYALEHKGERLSDLIDRAGGLTSDAYAAGVRFYRPERVPGDTMPRMNRVNVDLTEILRYPDEPSDIALADGDSIHIPEYLPVVQVDGAVLFPTSVVYREGEGLGYYIENAGGYARDADKNRTRVEYANGSVETVSKFLIFKSSPDPGPGSRIYVPGKEKGGGIDIRALTAVLTSAATIFALLSRN